MIAIIRIIEKSTPVADNSCNEPDISIAEAAWRTYMDSDGLRLYRNDQVIDVEPMMVYLMTIDGGECKIGISSNPVEVVNQLSATLPSVRLLTMFQADNAIEVESILRKTYQSKMVGGEWFTLSENDVEVIESIVSFRNGKFSIAGPTKLRFKNKLWKRRHKLMILNESFDKET